MSITKPSFWSRPRGPLLLSAAACVACCTVPLTAVVIGAGAASTIAAIAEPLAGMLLATGTVLGIALYIRRRRAQPSAAACSIDESCGCGPRTKRTLFSSAEPVADAPVACTVDLSDRAMVQKGLAEYRRAFEHLVASHRTPTGFRWSFRNAPGLEPLLRQLAQGEAACCSFMKFDLVVTPSEITWDVRAEAHARTMIDEYFRLPERLREELRSGHDLIYLKRASEKAGLVFTADQPR